ncbi:MAG TPA: enolase C-terminal domain-like protein, partial [Thermomicrobiaceae bacterium]|nr:enolase C-terminal domain-like protein [Thermomicrobiaceae bacterium]
AALPPGVALRLDANGGWSVAEALALLRSVAPLGIELIEQPVAAADLEGLARVRAAGLVPVAADEAVTDLETVKRIVALGAADVLVVKPMLAGGPRAGRAIVEMARAAGLCALVTTTIDSGVGIAAALHLAATLPNPPLACGLGTRSLLAGDLVTGLPPVVSGSLRLPSGFGLGIRLDHDAGERWVASVDVVH